MHDNQGSIRVRFAAGGEEASVDMSTLLEWIASGRVTAGDSVNGKLLTNGEWRKLGDMALYYKVRKENVPDWVKDQIVERASAISNSRSALRLISTLCKIAAVIVLIGTIILIVEAISVISNMEPLMSQVPSGGFGSIGGLAIAGEFVKGAIIALLLWALGEIIPLWIDIEDNTRRTARNTKPGE